MPVGWESQPRRCSHVLAGQHEGLLGARAPFATPPGESQSAKMIRRVRRNESKMGVKV